MRTLASVSVIFILAFSQSLAQNTFPRWVPDGVVNALVATGNTLYVGGSFTALLPRIHPLQGSSGVVFTASSTMANHQFPILRAGNFLYAEVSIVVPDGMGGWYMSGRLEGVGENQRSSLAQISSTGTVSNWQPPIGLKDVQSIAAANNTVVIAGRLQSGSTSVSGLFAVDTQTGQNIQWRYPIQGDIRSMVVKNDILYVGGTFKEVGQQQRKGLAAFNIRTGTLLSWNPFDESYSLRDFSCTSLALGDTTLYACGISTFLDYIPNARRSRAFLMEFSLRNGVPTSWQPSLDGRNAELLAVTRYGLVVCSRTLTPFSSSSVTLFDRSSGAVQDSSIFAKGSILAMTVRDSLLYLGGSFTTINTQSRSNLAAINLSARQLTDWAPYANRQVSCLSTVGENLYVGGKFNVCGLPFIRRTNLVAMDTESGDVLPWNPTANDDVTKDDNSTIHALHLTATTVYVGGKFSTINGRPQRSLAAFDVASGKILESFTSPFMRDTPEIFSLALDNKEREINKSVLSKVVFCQ